jgi:APA family basic amino acid/polyamine antiporter
MVLKILAIAALVVCGLVLGERVNETHALLDRPASFDLLTSFGAALVPVIFAYGGWQTATFVAGEIK